jgi:hypothetical protein
MGLDRRHHRYSSGSDSLQSPNSFTSLINVINLIFLLFLIQRIQVNARVFSSMQNEQIYPWLYDSVVHQGYLCKFCGHSSSSQEFVTVGINLGTVWLLFYINLDFGMRYKSRYWYYGINLGFGMRDNLDLYRISKPRFISYIKT